mgnify:CR=1 FL=1
MQQRNMFKTVEIKKGKDTFQASLDEGVLSAPNKLGKDVTEVDVDGKTYKVLESTIDERDDLIYLTLELPKGSSGAKSNDESSEG